MTTLTTRRPAAATVTTPAPPRPFNRPAYVKLISAALPLPPENEADNERLTRIMFDLDERGELGQLSPEEETFSELLTIVIQDFEQKHYPIPDLAPHEYLRCILEQRGLKHKDLAAIVGNKGFTTEILAGRRKISPAVAKRLSAGLRLSLDSLL